MSYYQKILSGLFILAVLSSTACKKINHADSAIPIPHETQLISKILADEINLPSSSTSQEDMARYIYALSRAYDVDSALILALIKVESNFNPQARSSKGAMGLMQVMPIVIKAVKADITVSERKELYDPYKNLHVGVHYLDTLLQKYRGNLMYTLTAYNMGPTALDSLKKTEANLPLSYYRKVMRHYYEYQKELSFKPDTI